MIPLAFFNPISIIVSLSVLVGVVIHDTQIDKLTTAVIGVPAVIATYEGFNKAVEKSEPHTHTERVSLSQVVRNMNAQNNRTQSRLFEDKKYMSFKNVARGHNAFDNCYLPMV